MSKYTIQLDELVLSMTYGSTSSLSERINEALPLIFNFNFPLWSEDYRETIERKIVMHYIKNEICAETVELWQLFLEERLNLIMPYYNKMYLSTIQEYDITKDHSNTITNSENATSTHTANDVNTITDTENGTHTGANKLTSTNTTSTSGSDEDVEYNLPQSKNDGRDYASFLKDNTSNISQNSNSENDTTINEATTNSKTTNANNTSNNTQNNEKTSNIVESGNNVPISELLIKYRESLINIDNLIIEELHDLFMLIY